MCVPSPITVQVFDIAGKGIANHSSFSEAVYKARAIFFKTFGIPPIRLEDGNPSH